MSSLATDVKEMVQEQYDYRELLYQMARRDLMLRYKQTIMGFGWAVFMPLLNTVIFSIVFVKAVPLDVGVPYPVFAFTGLLAWNFFASSVRFSLSSLTSNVNLVAKVFFPREIFPFAAVIVATVDFAVGSLALILLMIYYRIGVGPVVLLLPVVLLVHVLFTAGVSLLAAMANLFFRDVKYVFEVVLQAWMFATSVLYPLDRLDGVAGTLLALNPMTPIVDSYRAVLLRGELPKWRPLLVTGLVSLATFAWAWVQFHRAEYQFAESV